MCCYWWKPYFHTNLVFSLFSLVVMVTPALQHVVVVITPALQIAVFGITPALEPVVYDFSLKSETRT
ncbi:hypothetical protein DPMN_166027 [Dreissena polymorpha]|uniref:Uncharacterized protein n=1 Tax=Dreissena polymorpha TaxID=45954 RepID=A0A9D4ITT3_DREPO|nr:hypothetical protein DPMN_166027 [Dreissena polymorpha]